MVQLNIISICLGLILATLSLNASANSSANFIVQKASETSIENVNPIENCPLTLQYENDLSASIPLFSLNVENKTVYITIIGNTVFTAQDFLNNPAIKNLITNSKEKNFDLESFKQFYTNFANAITNYYLNQGYITSKAVINPLPPITQNAEIKIPILEGKIAELQLIGRERLALSYICDRLLSDIDSPLNITQLEEHFRLLSINPLFESVDANIKASGKTGFSILVATIKESDNWKFGIGIDNFSPPSIGSDRSGTFLQNTNLTGWGDNLSVAYYRSTTDGGNTLDAIYERPLNAQEGTLQIRVIPTWTRITQDPLDDFNITGNKQVYELSFRQPLWRSFLDEFALSLGFRYQNGQTLIDGQVAPIENARNRSTIFQFGQDYLSRDQQGFWFLQSQFNWGVDMFDATIRSGSTPDSRFFSWLFQVQRVQRWDDNHLMIIQGELQLTPDALLPDQWFLLGGGQSVRGYRQNIRFGDNGFRLSVEDRLTILADNTNQSSLQIAPFLDLGSVWFATDNNNSSTKKFLIGTGLGIIWNNAATIQGLNLRLDYGIPLIPLPHLGDNLQEQGVYFQINYSP